MSEDRKAKVESILALMNAKEMELRIKFQVAMARLDEMRERMLDIEDRYDAGSYSLDDEGVE